MLKLLFLTSIAAIVVCLGLSAAFTYFKPLDTLLMLQNAGFQLLVFFMLAAFYHYGKSSKDFSALLLVAIVLRLLACLVYVLVLRLQHGSVYFLAAIHFMIMFIVFTVVDVRFAIAVIRLKAIK